MPHDGPEDSAIDRDALGHVKLVVDDVSALLDPLDFLLRELREGDRLDAVGELPVDPAARRAHEGVKVDDDPLRQLDAKRTGV